MSLAYYLTAAVSGLAILHLLWLPALRRRLAIDHTPAAVLIFALIALFQTLRTILLITALATAAALGLMISIQLSGGTTPEATQTTLARIRELLALIEYVSPRWGIVASLVLILGLCIYARRRGRTVGQHIYRQAFRAQYQALLLAYEQGGGLLEPRLPPTPEMSQLQIHIRRLYARLHEHELLFRGDEHERRRLDRLREEIAEAERALRDQDIVRRIEVYIDPEQIVVPPSRHLLGKAGDLLISYGLLRLFDRASRLLFVSMIALLIPSLLVATGSPLSQSLSRHQAYLQNLQVDWTAAQVDVEFREQISQVPPEQQTELTPAQQAIVDEAAQVITEELLRPQISPSAISAMNDSMEALARQLPEEPQLLPGALINGLDNPYLVIRSRLTSACKRSPGLIGQLQAELELFRRPASGQDLSTRLASYMFASVADGAIDDRLGRYVHKALSGSDPALLRRLHRSQGDRVILSLMSGKPLAAALREVQASPERVRYNAIFTSFIAGYSDDVQHMFSAARFAATVDQHEARGMTRLVREYGDDFGRFLRRLIQSAL